MPLPYTDLPPDIECVLRGREWTAVQIGMSRAAVHRFEGGLYLKSVRLNPVDHCYGNLKVEKERLEWLQGIVNVPEVVAFATDADRDYLVTTEMPGQNAAIAVLSVDAIERVIESIAAACLQLHSVAIGDCPFHTSSQLLIEDARFRLDAGLVDCNDFDEARLGRDPHELLDELIAQRPSGDDLVLTHGDLCLPNIIVRDERVSALVDVGRAAVSDRWHDLALCARSIASNWSDDAAATFLRAYGADEHDAKRKFYVLLDEFF